jgi:hypothetical protein
LAPHKLVLDIGQSRIEAPHHLHPHPPRPPPPIEALSCFPLVPYNLHTWKLKCIWDKIELLLGTPWGTLRELGEPLWNLMGTGK